MMRLTPLRKSLMTAAMLAAPLMLAAAAPALPMAKPGPRPACVVGKAAHPSIQSAVDDVNCSSVNVPPGTFFENVTVRRDLTIRGVGPQGTVVNGGGLGPVFALNGGMLPTDSISVTLEGMTITGGTGPACPPIQPLCSTRNGGGISSVRAVITVKDSIITGNTTWGNGGGISFVFGALTLKNSVVSGNTAFAYPDRPPTLVFGGGGIRGAGGQNVMTVVDSLISDNISWRQGGGILSVTSSGEFGTLIVKNSIIRNNEARVPPYGGAIYADRTTLTLKDNLIVDNTEPQVYP